MKIDYSFSQLPWKKGLSKIIKSHQKALEPLLIFRTCDPKTDLEIAKFFTSRPQCYFVRLSASCTTAHIEHDLALQLNLSFDISSYKQKVFLKISREIKRLHPPVIIVVDYCHRLVTRHLFRIAMLMRELERVAQFIFLFPAHYQGIWIKKLSDGDSHLKYFLKIIHKTYYIGLE